MPGLRRLLRGFWGAQIVAWCNLQVAGPAAASGSWPMLSRWMVMITRLSYSQPRFIHHRWIQGPPLQKAFPNPCMAPSSIHFPAGDSVHSWLWLGWEKGTWSSTSWLPPPMEYAIQKSEPILLSCILQGFSFHLYPMYWGGLNGRSHGKSKAARVPAPVSAQEVRHVPKNLSDQTSTFFLQTEAEWHRGLFCFDTLALVGWRFASLMCLMKTKLFRIRFLFLLNLDASFHMAVAFARRWLRLWRSTAPL